MIELPPDFSDKNVLKKVQKYNEAFSKQKWDKVEDSVKDFFKDLQGNPEDPNPILYILSIIAEDYPESITEERVKLVETFLIGKELKPKTKS